MSVLFEIINGWKNLAFPDPHTEKVAHARASICVKCPELQENKTCGKCGCFMPAKMRSMESKCPINKW